MSTPKLGIIGGGQLGSLLSEAAKSLNVDTVILTDDINAPAKNFTENFISGNYEDENLINEFINKVDLVTFEFENIPYKILKNIKNGLTFNERYQLLASHYFLILVIFQLQSILLALVLLLEQFLRLHQQTLLE